MKVGCCCSPPRPPRRSRPSTIRDGDTLLFGQESAGAPEAVHARRGRRGLFIPIAREARSLNLVTAASMAAAVRAGANGRISIAPRSGLGSEPMTDEIDRYKTQAKAWFDALQTRIVAEFEQLEDEKPEKSCTPASRARFELKPWVREAGGGGTMGILRGRFFEKCGVHVSLVHGPVTAQMAQVMPGKEGQTFYATGVSVIAHLVSPRVPAVHMNTRFIAAGDQFWFGGGADLSPLMDEQRSQAADDAVVFHAAMKAACDPFDADRYDKLKAWCDEYFYLPHRQEPRGTWRHLLRPASPPATRRPISPSPAPSANSSWRSIPGSSATAWMSRGPPPTVRSNWSAAAAMWSSTCSTTAAPCSASRPAATSRASCPPCPRW